MITDGDDDDDDDDGDDGDGGDGGGCGCHFEFSIKQTPDQCVW